MPKFEITIYNEQVRKLVSEGDSHKRYTDDWGDSHYIEYNAEDEQRAIAKCRQRYPAEDGFVIEAVSVA